MRTISQDRISYRQLEVRDDRILVERIPESLPLIVLTDARPKTAKGIIRRVGPGKWQPGEWWKVKREVFGTMRGSKGRKVLHDAWEWQWFPGYRQALDVHAGDTILFNPRWNDFAHAENVPTGCDLKGPLTRPLPIGADPEWFLLREADVLCILQ